MRGEAQFRMARADGLWRCGAKGDVEAIELIRAAAPDTPLPPLLRGPEGVSLCVALGPSALPAALRLTRDASVYWNEPFTDD